MATSVFSYYAPTYFPPSFFYLSVTTAATPTAGDTPYNAPSYFPQSYFYGASAASGPGMSYYAPTYFPPSYFYGTGVTSTPIPIPIPTPDPIPGPAVNPGSTPGRDQSAYETLLSLIRGLGVFEDVIFGASIQRNQAGAGCYPLAIVTPRGWDESDDYDPISIVRRTIFGITIVVQSRDSEPQFDQLDRLSCAIVRVVDFAGLGDSSLPALTRIRAGRYETSTHYPEQSVELEGEFSSLIDSSSSSTATH